MSEQYHQKYFDDLITEIKSEKYKYYHKPEYEYCSMDGYMCRCCEPKPIIKTHPLKHISPLIKNYYILVLTSVIYNGNSLSCTTTELQDDEDIVIAAVQQSGGALQYASARLRNSRKIVSIAVAQWAKSLQYASESLKSDLEIIKLIILERHGGLRYESKELKSEEDIFYAMLKSKGYAFYQIHESIKSFDIITFIQTQIDKYTRISIILSKKLNNDISNFIIKFLCGYSSDKLIKELIDMKSLHQ
jgi:hypothetical protein